MVEFASNSTIGSILNNCGQQVYLQNNNVITPVPWSRTLKGFLKEWLDVNDDSDGIQVQIKKIVALCLVN